MKKNINEIRNVIKKILFKEYKLKTISDLETLDGETLAEIYEALKCVQEEYGLSDGETQNIVDNIDN